jgi:hypothetical protein
VKFQVEHTVQYLYSKPVFLEPHVLRLRPRNDPASAARVEGTFRGTGARSDMSVQLAIQTS